ncbi:MAG TPA: biopolymer transporter ExbD [Sphingomicrobium sp.]|nr:biopolymer transporter ExbD [Sphingomicrobium sp.]
MSQPALLGTDAPIDSINTTPLIDVLLVLLVMFIITVPVQPHAIKLDLPQATPLPADRIANLLVIRADGSLLWNNEPISRSQLRDQLAVTRQMPSAPELHLRPERDARHGDVDAVLAIIKREQVSRFSFVGNEAYLKVF